MRSASAVTSTIPDVSVRDELATELVTVLLKSDRVPADRFVHQTRRKIACEAATPIHMLLAVSIEEADALEVPIDRVTLVYEQIAALLRERRRQRMEGMTGQTHAIAGPSLLREIQREDRAEHAENEAERALLVDEEDPDAIQALLDASAVEQHEMKRRDARLLEVQARLRLARAAR